jgi:oligopeptide/dipeptide ABC transporter ATP-binding protein
MKKILSVKDLCVSSTKNTQSSILKNIDIEILKGQAYGIMGETGSGKTMAAKAIMGLLPHGTKRTFGKINLNGKQLHQLSKKSMRSILGKDIAFIPQNTAGAFNPLHTIGSQLKSILKNCKGLNNSESEEIAMKWLTTVKLNDIDRVFKSYPFQLSGGQNQRILIAIALALKPKLLIADEPTTALDKINKNKILDLFIELQDQYSLTILFISHDISVIQNLCKRVAVMYAGEIVEEGTENEIFNHPRHPYVIDLLKSFHYNGKENSLKEEDVSTLQFLSRGCGYYRRCSERMDRCQTDNPSLYQITENQKTRCFLYEGKD